MSFRVRSKDPQVRAIIKGIQRDLTGRAGCRWDNIDDDIQQEIVNAWVTIAERVLQTSVSHSNRGGASSPTSTIDAAIDVFAQAPNAPGARTQLRAAIDSYARGKLGDLTDVVHEAATALASRRLTGTSALPAFVKALREQGRTDVQLERMLADVFEGLVTSTCAAIRRRASTHAKRRTSRHEEGQRRHHQRVARRSRPGYRQHRDGATHHTPTGGCW